MAKKVSVTLIDDYDGESVAHETVQFAVDGVFYEIDLSNLNSARLRGQLEEWTAKARKVHGKKTVKSDTAKSDRGESTRVREWARANGYPMMGHRGRISAEVLDAYRAANQDR